MNISKTCEKAINVMRYISSGAAETIAFEKSWGVEYSHEEIKNHFEECKKNINWHEIFDLPDDERKLLGFCYWDKPEITEKHTPMLIPLWIVECLPKGFKLQTSSINGKNTELDFDKIDKDTRGGCIAYMY